MRKLFAIVFAFFSILSFSKELKIDKNVVHGTLSNGMKYYIRHNVKPKERADFYIVHNVGAILENDDQNGLAHFCEHMAFNGTKHFPKKGVLNFLERQGVKFGHNVNAFTGQDVTCYNLNDVPVTKSIVIDSALLILHDWSNYISFEDEEIDAERGVIHEEWRTRRTPARRISIKHAPAMYNNSKYTHRDVIGLLDVIDNCSYETMRNFYHDWYRPDLQAVIVVGDIDVEDMEKRVKELFNRIPKYKNPKERYQVEIPNNVEPLISVATDPEQTSSVFRVLNKRDITKPADKNEDYIKKNILNSFFTSILNTRIGEILQKENPPFISGGSGYGSLTPTKDVYTLYSLVKADAPLKGLKAVLLENKRIMQYGITAGELERQKINALRSLEVSYKERNKKTNNSYVWQYFGNFLSNEPIPGAEFNYKFKKEFIKSLTLEQLNAHYKGFSPDENKVITFSGPEKEGVKVPTKEEILKVLKEVKTTKVTAYEDNAVKAELLDASKIKPGKIVNSKVNKKYDFQEITLENGIKVIMKKTDFKDDQILLSAYSPGGSSIYPNNYIPSIDLTGTIVNMSGLGDFNNIDLRKVMTGKAVSVSPNIGGLYEGFGGSSTVKDFETMFQLIHLYFTKPRFDKTAFNAYVSRLMAYAKNQSLDPRKIYSDTLNYIKYNNHPRIQKFNVDFIKKAELSKIEEMFRDRYKDASDFTFFFVGNLDFDKTKEFAKKYLANLPSINRKETWKDNKVRAVKGKVIKEIKQKLKVDKSTVYIYFQQEMKHNLLNSALKDALKHVLQLRYTESIREKEGGTYGVGVGAHLQQEPYENFSLVVRFDCDPEKRKKLISIVHEEINKIVKEGPLAKDVHKYVENAKKVRKEQQRKNGYWLGNIKYLYQYDLDLLDNDAFNKRLEKITVKSIHDFAKSINFKDYIEVVNVPIK